MRTLRLVILLLGFAASARAEAPEWLRHASTVPTPESAAKASAVVLLDETIYEITPKGGYIEVHRRAVRILANPGRTRAVAYLTYNGVSDKIEYLGAWLIRKGETIETKKKGDWIDFAHNAAGAVVDEYRRSETNLKEKAVLGDTFGYETRRTGSMLVAQLGGTFGSDLPLVRESITLVLPPAFDLAVKIAGPVPLVETRPNDHTWKWSNENRPYFPEESYEHPAARIDATVYFTIKPPAGAGFPALQFSSWSEVVEYYNRLNVGQCDTSVDLASKARELTAGAAGPLAKIDALARHVQKLRYIGINQNYQLGYGYRPRKASVVFATGFGDCKDKANLLVAMLREVGISAYPVGAYLGELRLVLPDYPTPAQFNHAIVAIPVDESVQLPAVVAVENLGRVLIFDATDPYTQLGDLSDLLQGGYVHVEATGNNQLTLLPTFAATDDFCLNRRLELTLAADGKIEMNGKISGIGQSGASLRRQFESANMPKELEALVTQQLNDRFRGAVVLEKKTDDDRATGRCTLSFTCAQPKYVQWFGDGTGIAKLDLLSRKYLPSFSENERRLPVGLPPLAINDEFTLAVPAGFVVTEFPASSKISSRFGSFEVTCEQHEGRLVFKRSVVLNKTEVPVAEYALLRKFFSDIAKADRAAVLLKRQS